MKYIIVSLVLFLTVSCNPTNENKTEAPAKKENSIEKLENNAMKNYDFLKGMYSDSYFPKNMVDRVKSILVKLCSQIESNKPNNLEELYKLTHQATIEINGL